MIIDKIIERAKRQRRVIILPESKDERVIEAGIKAHREKIADIVFIGNEDEVKNNFLDKDFLDIKFVDPQTYLKKEEFINKFYEMRKSKGMSLELAREVITRNYMYFACMMVECGDADGIVSGACHSSGETLKPALQIIKKADDSELVSSFFLMEVPDCRYGDNGVFIFSDAGLVQNPSSLELASIANSSAKSFFLLTGSEAKVAFLSHSTFGSAKHELVDKVCDAVKIAHEKYPNLVCDGELQLDAAIDVEVAHLKGVASSVAGHANTLIFPNLDAGNIGYKLVQRLAKANAYGPITQGIKKPVNDLSRGCNIDDIVGVIAITSVQCN